MRLNYGLISTCALLAACATSQAPPAGAPARQAAGGTSKPASSLTAAQADWRTFGGSNARSNANMAPSRITAANVGSLVRMQVKISAPIDAGLIYLRGVQVNGAAHDVFFGTTNLGRTVAIDANEGKVLWEYVPPGFDEARAAAGSTPPNPRMTLTVKQITNSTPVADDNRQYIYAAGADGKVAKISIADGKALWSTSVTKNAVMEKMDSPLSFVNGKILVPTAGYVGDTPPYQGHVVVLDAKTGAIEHVWNSLCSDRQELIDPASCPQTQSAIWGRAGIVVDPASGNMLFSTGNGPWDGKTAWGDALIMLDANATKMTGNWTTTNNEELNRRDLDMGSTSPVLLGDGYIAQGGKDGTIRVITMEQIKGTAPHQGNEVQIVDVPGKRQLLSGSATAKIDGKTWLFASVSRGGTTAWTFGPDHKLTEGWKSTTGGNTPFYAGGLLYIFEIESQAAGHVRVFEATTGKLVATLDCGGGHWNHAIVADDRIALPEGYIPGFGGMGTLPEPIVNIWKLP